MSDPALPSLDQRLQIRNRPDGAAAMYQSWQHLLFLHWEADPAQLASTLPPGLHLDLFEGKAYLGVVPFYMRRVRPRGLPPAPWLSNFLELNVRTYVHDDNGVPGVWFFSLDANQRIACWIGRTQFHLPYRYTRMSAREDDFIDYEALGSNPGDRAHYRYRGLGAGAPASPGSFEFFLVERYLLFAHNAKNGGIFSGRVHHDPYLVQDVDVEVYSRAPIGWDRLPVPESRPVHQCYAREVSVEVFSLERAR